MDRKQKFLEIFQEISPDPAWCAKGREFADKLEELNFFQAPASTKYHGNYEGGLFDHSLAYYEELMKLTTGLGLKWERPVSPAIIAFFHDLCKVDKYVPYATVDNDTGIGWEYDKTPSTWGEGHATKSLAIAATLCRLTEEEVLCIRYHMGAYEKDEWANYDAAIRRCPNVLFSHTADMMAIKIRNT